MTAMKRGGSVSTAAADRRVGTTLGPYRIERVLGRGGMSVVYEARELSLDRTVALKVLAPELAEDEEFRARFSRESRVAAALEHPNVVPVYAAGELGGSLWIAMRYIPGTDLRALLAQGPIDLERTVGILRQVARALDAAHEAGLVHRDVKPANILLAAGGDPLHAYLTDFGLTKRVTGPSVTATSEFLGTVDYASPEQVEGAPLDGRADQYSLGCVAFHCLTGAPPFSNRTETIAVLWAHVAEPPPKASERVGDVRSGVDEVLSRAMAKDPQDRYPTCEALVQALGDQLPGRGLGLDSPTRGTASPPSPARKAVTVVAVVLPGEGADPEVAAASEESLAGEATAVLGGHGATVQLPLPGRVVGIFGHPELHEDDALRALRAAQALSGTMPAARVGIDTGVVLASHDLKGPVLGGAIRLSEAAGAGEVLLTKATLERAPTAQSEPSGGAHRLVTVSRATDALPRRTDIPLVGREAELATLRDAFGRVLRERACNVLTVLGAPGVGKSRLASELAAHVQGEATVLRGRCLPYGEGITFWPVAEMLTQAAGITDADSPEVAKGKISSLLAGHPDGELVAERVASLVALSAAGAPAEEGRWAFRKLLEHLARGRPVVVQVDDLQWAEPGLFEALEHVVDLCTGPVLLLCLARPELYERRGDWGAGKLNAATIVLEPLTKEEGARLAEGLLGSLHPEVRDLVVRSSGGNPLFLEQMAEAWVEQGVLRRDDGSWVLSVPPSEVPVPPTVSAVVAARLDHLPPPERQVLLAASVVGERFSPIELAELIAPQAAPVEALLAALTRKRLVQATPGPGEPYAFAHLLVRDVAYEALPKATRAGLHERMADHLERVAGSRIDEVAEIVGYHLERAYRYLIELGSDNERAAALARRAGDMVGLAGKRAFDRSDLPAAVDLLERALDLASREEPGRPETQLLLGQALAESGRPDDAERALQAAEQSVLPDIAARARLQLLQLELFTEGGRGWFEKAAREAGAAIAVLEVASDHAGLAEAFFLVAMSHGHVGRHATAWEYIVRAATHWRLAGDPYREARMLTMSTGSATFGPMPATEAIAWCETVLDRAAESPLAVANTNANLGMLLGFRGDFDRGRELIEEAGERLGKLGVLTGHAGALGLRAQRLCELELLAGRPEAAERAVRPGVEASSSVGDVNILASLQGTLAEALQRQGMLDEADAAARRAVELSAPEDVHAQVWWRAALAGVLAQRGQTGEAVRVAREAVGIVAPTDVLWLQGTAWVALADALARAGRTDEARDAYAEALARFEAKGIVPAVERVRSDLAGLP